MRITAAASVALAAGSLFVQAVMPRGAASSVHAAAAPQAPGQAGGQPVASGGRSRIRGRVVAADTGRPLARAEVQVRWQGSGEPRTTTTEASGRYDVGDLPAGSYLVSASRPTYVSAPFGGRLPGDAGKLVKVGEAETADDIDIRLYRPGAISGRVVDERGDPIPYVKMVVLERDYMAGVARLRVVPRSAECTTDDRGEYRLFDLPSGTYYVVAAPSPASGTNTGDGRGYAPTFFPGFADPGQAEPVHVEVGRDEQGVDLTLAALRMGGVVGTALDAMGRPVSAGTVTAVLVGAGRAAIDTHSTSVRADGQFTFRSLPPGDYVFTAVTRSSSLILPAPGIGRGRLSLAGDEVATLTIQSNPGGTLSGRIVAENEPTVPVQGIRVSPLAMEPVPAVPGGMADGRVNARNMFSLSGLFGEVMLRVDGVPAGWMVKSMTVNAQDVSDVPITFAGRERFTNAEVVLTRAVTKLFGQVIGRNGTPVQVAYVLVLPTDPRYWSTFSRRRGSAVVRDGAPFAIDGLPPGRYFAVALAENPVGLDVYDPRTIEDLQRDGVAFSLDHGGSATVTLKIR